MEYTPISRIIEMLDVQLGDNLLISSDILAWATVAAKHEKAFSPKSFLKTFLKNVMEQIGVKGTLLLPTFNWDFCRGLPFDYFKTPCKTGILGSIALGMPEFKRTKHPIYSFAVWGKDQEYLCSLDNTGSFASDSPFAYLHQHGKNLIIDVSFSYCLTFTHYVEEQVGVPYRYKKNFTALYTDESGKTEQRTYSMLVRNLELNVKNMTDPISEDMLQNGTLVRNNINGVNFDLFRFSDFYEAARLDILENQSKKLVRYDGQ